ncbi:MAG TPA: hypothetical protein VF759_04595 [Allosphingosinicella sp.]|jgi:hypothetical protein
MKYFFPVTSNEARAEFFWERCRDLLADNGFRTTRRRIHALYFRREGEPRIYQVGVQDPDTGELVLLIYRAANAPFYWVCTPGFGLLELAPIPVPASAVTKAVDFED